MKYYLINLIIFFLPHSRCLSFKTKLLRWAGCSIEENVRVMRIRVAGINLKIGKNTFIGDETILFGTVGTNIKIGKNCDISGRVNIITGTHQIGTIEEAAGEGYGKDITIEDGVWIGFGSTILPGVTIGKAAIIAAGSVVTHNVAPGTMVAGVPAKFKKQIFPQSNFK